MLKFLFVCFLFCQTHYVYAKDIKIVTTIKPIHSLISMIADKTDTVVALVDKNNSPHHFSLKPSAIRHFHSSDMVIIINPKFETFINSSLKIIPQDIPVVFLSDAEKLTLYPTQSYGLAYGLAYNLEHKAHSATDYHIWLSPQNAIKMIHYIASELVKINPTKQEIYKDNLKLAEQKLRKLDTDLQKTLKFIQDKPFMVFHNGYEYFIKAYHLNLVGVITDNPAAYSSLKRIKFAQKQLRDHKVECVFKEPQFSSKPIETVIADAQTPIGILDPLGSAITADKEHYFILMRNLAQNLTDCFSDSTQLK